MAIIDRLKNVHSWESMVTIVVYIVVVGFVICWGAYLSIDSMWMTGLVALGIPANTIFSKLFAGGQQTVQFPVTSKDLGAKQEKF